MSRTVTGVIIALLVITAAGAWALFAVENSRRNFEIRQGEASRQAALETAAHSAWQHATRYETFDLPLTYSGQKPKRDKLLSNREIWVKSFQYSDVKSLGKSQRYGNAAYQLNTTIGVCDRLPESMLDVAEKKGVSSSVIAAAFRGEWKNLIMMCKVERLDGGEWVVSDYKFSKAITKPDFPFEKVDGN